MKFSIFSFLFSKNSLRSQVGFTLIELIVSIGILGILAVFVLAALNPLQQFQKARDGQRKSDLSEVQKSLEQYYQDYGHYPPNPAATDYEIKDEKQGTTIPFDGKHAWTPYMDLLPADPDTSRTYIYYSDPASGNQKYVLYASLERGPLDPQTCKTSDTNCQKNPTSTQYCSCSNVPSGATCGTGNVCNYGVSSPNTTP